MGRGGVAAGASKVFAVHAHVYIQIFVRVMKGGIQIPVFHRFSAAAIEVASSAVAAAGQADALGAFSDSALNFSGDIHITGFLEKGIIIKFIPPFDVFLGMAEQAVDPFFFFIPADMTGGAVRVFHLIA